MDPVIRLKREIAELEALIERYRKSNAPRREFGLGLMRDEAARCRSQLKVLRRRGPLK